MQEDGAKTRPARVLRCSAVEAAIWVDHRVIDNAVVKLYSIRITKSYRQDSEWRNTTTFTAEDLPKVAMVATEAYRFLRLRSEEPADSVNGQRTAEDADVGCGAPSRPTMSQTSQSQQGRELETECLP